MIEPQFSFGKYHNKKKKQPIQNSENAKDTGSPQFHCRVNGFRSLTLATSLITIKLNKGSLSLSLLDFSEIFNAVIIHLQGKKPKQVKYISLLRISLNVLHCTRNEVQEKHTAPSETHCCKCRGSDTCLYHTAEPMRLWPRTSLRNYSEGIQTRKYQNKGESKKLSALRAVQPKLSTIYTSAQLKMSSPLLLKNNFFQYFKILWKIEWQHKNTEAFTIKKWSGRSCRYLTALTLIHLPSYTISLRI